MDRRMIQLGVGKVADLLDSQLHDDPEYIEKRLHFRYAHARIPQTEYFNLETPPVLPVQVKVVDTQPKPAVTAETIPTYTSNGAGCMTAIVTIGILLGFASCVSSISTPRNRAPYPPAPQPQISAPAPAPEAAKPTPKPELPQQASTGEEGIPTSAYKDSAPQPTQEPPPSPAVPTTGPGSYGQAPPAPPTPATPVPSPEEVAAIYIRIQIAEAVKQDTKTQHLGKEYNNALKEMQTDLVCTLAPTLSIEQAATIKLYTPLLRLPLSQEQRSFVVKQLATYDTDVSTLNAHIANCKSSKSV